MFAPRPYFELFANEIPCSKLTILHIDATGPKPSLFNISIATSQFVRIVGSKPASVEFT